MQTSSTHLHSPQRERQTESPQTKCSVLVRCSGGWGIFQIDPCVNAIQFYLHRSASSLHHHFKGKPLLKVDGLGFMDYLCFSIWIYEMVLANLHGVYNRVWKQISMHLYERWSRLYHCGEKDNLKYRRCHSMGWVLHYRDRRKEAKPKHFLNPPPDSRCRLIRSLRLPSAGLLHHGGLHPQLWATQSLPSCRSNKTRNWE